jgi:uncharacterized protein (DUF983 family)
MTETETWPPLSPYSTGIRGRCPRCGQGHLFDGFLTLKPACEVCGLDYSYADPADGPAFFVICFTCIPVAAIVVWIAITYDPPIWAYFLVSIPLLFITCVLPLRPLKGWLVNAQFYYKAEQGVIDRDYVRPAPGNAERKS